MDFSILETILKDTSTPILVFITLVYFSYKWYTNIVNRINSIETQCVEYKKKGEVRLLKIEQELSENRLEETNKLLNEILLLLNKFK